MKRYLSRAVREAAERMGISQKAVKRKLASLPIAQRAQLAAAKKRRMLLDVGAAKLLHQVAHSPWAKGAAEEAPGGEAAQPAASD